MGAVTAQHHNGIDIALAHEIGGPDRIIDRT